MTRRCIYEPMLEQAERLREDCNMALGAGKDFRTIWEEILQSSPLTVGPPEQRYNGAGIQLRIPLVNGQALIFSDDNFALA